MRTALDRLYRVSGALAALCLVAICAIVVAQVGGRMIDGLAKAVTGEQIGLLVPSAAEFSGFFLAGASFLALAYTLRHGGHIRVSLLVHRLTGRTQHWIELWCLGFALALSAFFSWHTLLLVLDSWAFEELSYGMIPVPLWIPQAAMALGLVVLTIALIDDLVAVLKGRNASYKSAEDSLLSEDGDEIFAE